MELKAFSYFQTLGELLAGTLATNRRHEELPLENALQQAVSLILSDEALIEKRKIMIIGNGGSAAIASHVHNDLCKAVGLKAIVFDEPPLLTALSNDHGYEVAFERLVELWAEKGDLLIAISSSGNSDNILRAVRMAHHKECPVITFSGFKPENSLRKLGDLNFYVPAQSYGLVEVSHMALTHYLTDRAMSERATALKGAL